MIDINLLRSEKGGNPSIVKESQRKRGKSEELVDTILDLDKDWIKLRTINALQKRITELVKAKEDIKDLLAEKKTLESQKSEINVLMTEKESQRDQLLSTIGNIVHDSVVTSMNEDNNDLVRTHVDEEHPPVEAPTEFLSHDQVLARLDGYDPERGQKVAGHRGYFLRDIGVRLNQALINYGLDFLSKRTYTLLQTPFVMRKELMSKTAQLEEFDEALFKVIGHEEGYLIATSEQPISAYHANEWIDPTSLPLRYGGISTCFRKEAGAHGKDTWGIFRVEQFVLCEPEKSWEIFDEMVSTSEAFYQSLGLSYRVVGIVSGALNNAAAKKYDVEAWFPKYKEFKELVSCSNCTDYQSRSLEIRCGSKTGDVKKYVHCLNATLTATERTLCCLLENYQTKEGLKVPKVLQSYLGGLDFIPYKK